MPATSIFIILKFNSQVIVWLVIIKKSGVDNIRRGTITQKVLAKIVPM